MLEPGARIDEYLVGHQIARGGFGTIWRVRHTHTGRIAALKILHPELISQQELVMRFEREAEAASRLQHPNIAEIYQRGALPDGSPYFVMEYVEGMDLDARLVTRGPLSPDDSLRIFEQLASALSAAHDQGIVHRDLKASNVLISQENGSLRVVLLDFGIAKLLDDSGPHLTGSRAMIGTPACMAPEQIRCEPVSRATDVYALGSLMYHMLTGEPPFSTDSMVATMYLHLHAPPPRPSHVCDVSPQLDDVVSKSMDKSPSMRFATVGEQVNAFRAALRKTREHPVVLPTVAPPVPALGLYVHVHADYKNDDAFDDELLDDMESIIPQVDAFLGARGYLLAHDNGNSALYVQPVSSTSIGALAHRHTWLTTAAALHREIADRDDRDDRVQVSIYLHIDDAQVDGEDVRGGALLDLDQWVPGANGDGIFGSSAVLQRPETAQDTAIGYPIRFYRIDPGQPGYPG